MHNSHKSKAIHMHLIATVIVAEIICKLCIPACYVVTHLFYYRINSHAWQSLVQNKSMINVI